MKMKRSYLELLLAFLERNSLRKLSGLLLVALIGYACFWLLNSWLIGLGAIQIGL